MDATSEGALIGVLAGFGIAAMFIGLIIAVFAIIVMWKIFAKAGEAGWKALIPIYNTYILCKIIGINFWIYVLAIPFGLGLITGFVGSESSLAGILSLISSLYSLVLVIMISVKLGKAFGKGTGFIIGLIFLSFIFEAILAFDSSQYVGPNRAA